MTLLLERATVQRMAVRFVAIALFTVLTGCLAPERIPYDAATASVASIAGFGDIRVYADETGNLPRERAWLPPPRNGEMSYLALSGGGAGGAFSVGVLKAWSESERHPQFDIVSGVSTGALIAPYAFLGPAHDGTLLELYTSGIAEKLVDVGFLPAGLLGASLLKQEPFRELVERHLTSDILARIAAEHRKGRRLLVLTSNLDAQRAVIWNMGAIAASGRPDALKLFQDVILASASLPGLYPAVLIRARAGEHVFEEMHSDGGSESQILTIPEGWLANRGKGAWPGGAKLTMYVLVNNALMPEFAMTTNNTFLVMARASSSLVKAQARSALLATYAYSRKAGFRFRMASIDKAVAYDMGEPFDTGYMRAVYRLGYERMAAGRLWSDRPTFTDTGSEPRTDAAR